MRRKIKRFPCAIFSWQIDFDQRSEQSLRIKSFVLTVFTQANIGRKGPNKKPVRRPLYQWYLLSYGQCHKNKLSGTRSRNRKKICKTSLKLWVLKILIVSLFYLDNIEVSLWILDNIFDSLDLIKRLVNNFLLVCQSNSLATTRFDLGFDLRFAVTTSG